MSKASRTIEIMEDYGRAGSVASVGDGPIIDQDGAPSSLPPHGLRVTRHGLDMASRPATTQEMETIRRLLGVSVVDEGRKLSAVVASIDTVREQTGRMVDAGVHIGRVLNDVHEVLSQEEFARFLRSGRELLSGWTSGNLSKMMGAARFVDSNKVSRDVLPRSYTVLYALSLLDHVQIQRAIERQLVRPSLTRGEVEQMRRIGYEEKAPPGDPGLPPEVQKLDARIESLVRDLRAARSERAELMAKVAGDT